MSDEMVQEKTETAVTTPPEHDPAVGSSGVEEAAAPVASTVGAAPTPADEPAPAQPVAQASPVDTSAETVTTTQPAAEAPATPAAPEASAEHEFEAAMNSMADYDRSLRQLQEGDVITGTVMRIDREGVLVDVGAKSEGIIRLGELSRDAGPNVNPENIVKVGEKIRVYVLEPENQDGNPILSKKRADFEQAWERVQLSKENNETITAMVTDRVKGGLVVDLGIRGFVPASHVGTGSLKTNLDKYVGQTIPLKVIEVDKERRKVVLSNKQAEDEHRKARSEETRTSLAPNQIRKGTVRRLTNYGAFIDLGGIDGLLHISEMSWTRINDPKEVLREGQELDVLVLKMDLENNRVSLGLRQILPDPWSEIASRYKEGDEITGTITRLVPFGAFVQVEGGVEGIIPNSEMPRNRTGKPGPTVNPNEEVTVKVLSVRPEERKMTLSLRALQPAEDRDAAPPPVREVAPGREPVAGREPREGGKRGRGERDRDERDDFSRYAPGRQEEPRFTIGDAFAAATKRNERPKRERRNNAPEYEEDLDDIDLDDTLDEPEAEVDHEAEAAVESKPEIESKSDAESKTEAEA